MADTPKTPFDLQESMRDLFSRIASLQNQSHFSTAITGSSVMEELLRMAIQTKMVWLSNRFEESIFENYGPLSSFSAKIDIAYALGIITDDLLGKLRAVKSIRNEFAHPKDHDVTFSSPQILKHLRKLGTIDETMARNHYPVFFMHRIQDINAYIGPIVDRHEELTADWREPPEPSPDK